MILFGSMTKYDKCARA